MDVRDHFMIYCRQHYYHNQMKIFERLKKLSLGAIQTFDIMTEKLRQWFLDASMSSLKRGLVAFLYSILLSVLNLVNAEQDFVQIRPKCTAILCVNSIIGRVRKQWRAIENGKLVRLLFCSIMSFMSIFHDINDKRLLTFLVGLSENLQSSSFGTKHLGPTQTVLTPWFT